tara:strand:+ start:446 stop:1072 length:627 start_codon:yes stop_codon:yes gene_type:complete
MDKMKANYYAIIPAFVRYAPIKANSKLLYGEITALSNKFGYCFATNNYFAELYNVSKNTISLWIKELKDSDFIKVEIIRNENKQIIKRKISITKNDERGLTKNLKENTTSNNTTSNNISLRKEDFEKSVKKSTNGYGYTLDLLNEFCDYWTEPNKANRRMKFEMETTFDISLRLKRWEKNSKRWNKTTHSNTKFHAQISEYEKAKKLI